MPIKEKSGYQKFVESRWTSAIVSVLFFLFIVYAFFSSNIPPGQQRAYFELLLTGKSAKQPEVRDSLP